jgi:hypothetical protein
MATQAAAPREDNRKEGDVETVDLGRGSAEGGEGKKDIEIDPEAFERARNMVFDTSWAEEDVAQKEARDTARTGDYPNEEDIFAKTYASYQAIRERVSESTDPQRVFMVNVLQAVDLVHGEATVIERVAGELWDLRGKLEGFEARNLVSAQCRDVPIPIPAAALLLSKRDELQRAMADMREKMHELEEFVQALDRSTILPEGDKQPPINIDELRIAIELGRVEELAEKPVDLDERRPSIPEVDEGGITNSGNPRRGWWR